MPRGIPGSGKSKTARKGRKPATDREVGNSTMFYGQPFVEKNGKVVGTPSGAPDHRRPGYAASSVIHRGTANELRAKILADQKGDHSCLCGCGQVPSNPESLFMPGHDSKVRSMGKAVKLGQIKETELTPGQRDYLEAGGML